MKTVILLFFSLILFFDQVLAQTNFKSEDEAIAKLKTYQSADLAQDRKTKAKAKAEAKVKEKQKLVIDQMFSDLKDTVAKFEKKKASEDLIYQMGRVAVLTFENDPSNYAVEILYPIYQKDKKEFEKKLQKLPEKERSQLIEALSDYERELTQGNG